MQSADLRNRLGEELGRQIRQCKSNRDRLEGERQQVLLLELTGGTSERGLAELDRLIGLAQRRLKRLEAERGRLLIFELERVLDRGVR